MKTDIYFRLSNGEALKRVAKKRGGFLVDGFEILKEVMRHFKSEECKLIKVAPANIRVIGCAVCEFEKDKVQVMLVPATKSPPSGIDTWSFAVHLRSFPLVSRRFFGFFNVADTSHPANEEHIQTVIRLLERILVKEMHAIDLRLLTHAETEAMSEFH